MGFRLEKYGPLLDSLAGYLEAAGLRTVTADDQYRSYTRRSATPTPLGNPTSSAGGEVAQRGHRSGLFVAGEIPPSGVMAGFPRQLGDEDPVGLQALIDHGFWHGS